jgi:hypothetical protein
MRPATKIVVTQPEHLNPEFSTSKQLFEYSSLFPDALEVGWKSLIHKGAHLMNAFDAFDDL